MPSKKNQLPLWQDRVCNSSQIGGIETSVIDNGSGKGVRIAWINTGTGLRYKVVIDRSMDIVDAFYNQHSLCWISHGGITSPRPDSDRGLNWLSTFAGGLFTTCGLSHVGVPEKDETGERGLHGKISNVPAELISIDQPDVLKGKLDFSIKGVMKETSVFGPSLELTRTISGRIGNAVINISDEVFNAGSEKAAHMLLYHCNFGWPLVDKGSRIVWDGKFSSRGNDFDDEFFSKIKDPQVCQPPLEKHRGSGEAAAFIDVKPDKKGNCAIGIYNRKLRLAAEINYSKKQLPCMTNWQHWGIGDYVTGLEPATNPPVGQSSARAGKALVTIDPLKTKKYKLSISVHDKKDAIDDFLKRAGHK